ncbi:MAG: LysM peptidoglycan-binding domain-containing protein [Acholeplasmatales bacterium]|nr:LysM peptidoglycan-binding domain-containing protein [Acholeplasmatales bacterium]
MEILTNKQYKKYDYISRYSPMPIYYHNLDDKYITGIDKWLSNDTIYSEYIVQKGDTYDKLALRYYNNPTYYWIICSFNHIHDPFENPEPGSKLKIPSFSNLQFEE